MSKPPERIDPLKLLPEPVKEAIRVLASKEGVLSALIQMLLIEEGKISEEDKAKKAPDISKLADTQVLQTLSVFVQHGMNMEKIIDSIADYRTRSTAQAIYKVALAAREAYLDVINDSSKDEPETTLAEIKRNKEGDVLLYFTLNIPYDKKLKALLRIGGNSHILDKVRLGNQVIVRINAAHLVTAAEPFELYLTTQAATEDKKLAFTNKYNLMPLRENIKSVEKQTQLPRI